MDFQHMEIVWGIFRSLILQDSLNLRWTDQAQ